MNYVSLQEEMWTALGLHDPAQRLDWRRQKIKDALNTVLVEIADACPYLWNLVRESTLALVASTGTYYLNDWCRRPMSFYTTDSAAHKVASRHPRNADRDGSRSTTLSISGTNGPWQLTWTPHNTSGAKTGAAASATEGATSITGLSGLAAVDVGRMIRLNGEENDYQIVSQATTSCVVDRAVRARLTGLGTTGVGAGYTSVRWEIGPPGRYRVQILPAPSEAYTLPYRYLAHPRKLVNTDETPELPEEFHHLMWKGALRLIGLHSDNDKKVALYGAEYAAALDLLRQRDQDLVDVEEGPHYESLDDVWTPPRGVQPGTYFRGY